MSDEDVTAKIDEAVRLIRDYIDTQVVVIGDAHQFWGYNKGRVDAYRDVSNLCAWFQDHGWPSGRRDGPAMTLTIKDHRRVGR